METPHCKTQMILNTFQTCGEKLDIHPKFLAFHENDAKTGKKQTTLICHSNTYAKSKPKSL